MDKDAGAEDSGESEDIDDINFDQFGLTKSDFLKMERIREACIGSDFSMMCISCDRDGPNACPRSLAVKTIKGTDVEMKELREEEAA